MVVRWVFTIKRTVHYNQHLTVFCLLIENALYCTARAVESVWALALKNGHVKNVPHGDIFVFMLSMGFLMPVYQHDKEVIGSTYLNVMTRLFGES